MDAVTKELLWKQFGASIDMLENAVLACPEEVWGDRVEDGTFWYLVFHTTFWLDLYLDGGMEGFRPPEPFGLEEIDPAGVLPPRVYTKAELLGYLAHCREKCRRVIGGLTAAEAGRPCRFSRGGGTFTELLLYNMRHVQHGAAQLNLMLRQRIDAAPRWVGQTATPLSG